jgi:hypothetical protein
LDPVNARQELSWHTSRAIPAAHLPGRPSRTNSHDIFAHKETHVPPGQYFFEQLITQLLLWKSINNDIVLLGDFNKNVYTGRLAARLSADDLNFVELCRKHTGIRIPPTHCRGSAPIDGIFATPGITCVNAFILPQYGGVGDHRCFIIDLTSESLIGTSFPNIVRCSARKLHCFSSRMVNLYCAELTSVCDRHNMFNCMDLLIRHTDFLAKDDFIQLINSWDSELTQFMIHLESHCSKFMMGHIEWSPTVGLWLSHWWLLHRICLWMIGVGVPDPRNMIRECLKLNLPNPRTSTYGTICAQIIVTNREIKRLSMNAPTLCRQHLHHLIETAKHNNEHIQARAITEIMKQEKQKGRWAWINHVTRPPRGGNSLAIRVMTPNGVERYDTEESVFQHASAHPSLCF